jgi:hypothetical protein
MAVAICAGASCAILVFLVQLITFLSWKGFNSILPRPTAGI